MAEQRLKCFCFTLEWLRELCFWGNFNWICIEFPSSRQSIGFVRECVFDKTRIFTVVSVVRYPCSARQKTFSWFFFVSFAISIWKSTCSLGLIASINFHQLNGAFGLSTLQRPQRNWSRLNRLDSTSKSLTILFFFTSIFSVAKIIDFKWI